MVVLGSVRPQSTRGALAEPIPAPGKSSGAVEWPPVYQRATAKPVSGTMTPLQNKDLRQNDAIDSQTETKVLLRRLKRHRDFGTLPLPLRRQ
jgi:hypothetical protein